MLGSLRGINWTSASLLLDSATDRVDSSSSVIGGSATNMVSSSSITGKGICTFLISLPPMTSVPAALGPILFTLPEPKKDTKTSVAVCLAHH